MPANLPIHGFGLGYYQNNQVLLRKYPLEEERGGSYYDRVKGIQSRMLIAHVRVDALGGFVGSNTHPFRFQRWLFAHHGKIPAIDQIRSSLQELLPEFLRRNIMGETDSELIFHVILAFLHDAGRLGDQISSPKPIVEAVGNTISLVNKLSKQVGSQARPILNFALGDGQTLVVTCHGAELRVRTIKGMESCELCTEQYIDVRESPVSHGSLRSVFIVSGQPQSTQGFEAVPDPGLVVVRRNLDVEILPL